MAAPIESKVTAGSASAAAAGVALWALQTWVFKSTAVPDGVVSLVYLIIPGVIAGVAGYLAPHTHRPDLTPAPAPAPPADTARP
jgi:predicted lysophospholipase L1 biosynthesis ABC-type transport system permease subunit